MKKFAEQKSFIVLCILFFGLVFGTGVLVGRAWNIEDYVEAEDGSKDMVKVLNLYSKNNSSEVNFDQFWQIWNTIKERHVDQPISDKDLFYGAIKGMVEGIGDPYSVYFPPVEAEEFAKDLNGEFDGIGAEIGIREEQLVVVAPLPGSPAEIAGLKPLDKILAIEENDTRGISLEKAVSLIRGKKGTAVKLTVMRSDSNDIEEISIVRDVINIPSVAWNTYEEDYAYLRIGYFNDNTVKEFDKAVEEIIAAQPKGIILDMRRNPGGFLDASIQVASEWVEKGIIVSERLTSGEEKVHESVGKHRLKDFKTIVLIDDSTASGAEIVAGALQDYDKATLVGIKTFGKGSVQSFDGLSDGSALKLTIAKWFTPSNRAIDHEGIMPDVIVEEMFVEEKTDENAESTFVDKGLEKAVELLKSNN